MNDLLNAIVPATFALIGIVLGIILQYRVNRTSEHFKNLQTSRTQAYVDFCRGVALMAQGNAINGKELLSDAKMRIGIYGSKRVIEGLAHYWRGGAELESPEARGKFVRLVEMMRADSLSTNESAESRDLSQILFSVDS